MKNETNGRKKSLLVAGVLVASLAAIPVAASAQTDDASNAPVDTQTEGAAEGVIDGGVVFAIDSESVDGVVAEGELVELGDLDEQTLAEIQEIEDSIAAELDAAGVGYEWVEEDGLRFVEIDWEDAAAVDAFDAILTDMFGADGVVVEMDGDDLEEFEIDAFDLDEFDLEDGAFEEFEWSEQDRAAFDAEQNELAAALDAAGVAYEWIDDDGLRFVEIDWADETAIDAFFDFYGEPIEVLSAEDLEEFDMEEFDTEEFDMDSIDGDLDED